MIYAKLLLYNYYMFEERIDKKIKGRYLSQEYRELRYTLSKDEVEYTCGDIMRDRLQLSSREISRCKQFDDGVMKVITEKTVPARLIDPILPGETLIVRLYEDNDNAGDIVPTDGELDIVYEDDDLIIINKEGDRVVHPSYAHYTDSLSNLLMGYYCRTGQKHIIRTVGRLDRETSGLVIFAKNRHSAALLSKQKENMSRRKEYLALCSGVFEQKEGTVNAPIRRRPDERMIREVHPEGQEAITHYTVLKQYDDYALVKLVLDTGRTHQIRVHMAYLGHPLLGDNFYGKHNPDNKGLKRAALHAGHIELLQPISGEKIVIDAPLPDDMGSII
jgi:23S rRNA pseudouridine1911/1915/1917 synthase